MGFQVSPVEVYMWMESFEQMALRSYAGIIPRLWFGLEPQLWIRT